MHALSLSLTSNKGVGAWILATRFWRDLGVWQDTASWRD